MIRIKLSHIAKIKTGLVLNRKKANRESSHCYSVVSLKSFNENAIYDHTFADKFFSNEQIKKDGLVKQGDILLRLREPNLAIYIDKEYKNLIYSSLMVRLKVIDDRFDPNFIAHFLNTNIVKKMLLSRISGTTIPMIKVADVNDIKVPLIDLTKQKKMVKYLKLFHKENELLEKLITQKKRYAKEVFETLASKG